MELLPVKSIIKWENKYFEIVSVIDGCHYMICQIDHDHIMGVDSLTIHNGLEKGIWELVSVYRF